MKLFKKKDKGEEEEEETTNIAVYQQTQIERLERKMDKLAAENEFLRAELHRRDDEDRELFRKSLRAQIAKDESPFGANVNSESLD